MVRGVPGGLRPALTFVYQGRLGHLGDAIDIAKNTGAVFISTPEVCHSWSKHKRETEAAWRCVHEDSEDALRGVELLPPQRVTPMRSNTLEIVLPTMHMHFVKQWGPIYFKMLDHGARMNMKYRAQ